MPLALPAAALFWLHGRGSSGRPGQDTEAQKVLSGSVRGSGRLASGSATEPRAG